MIYRCALGCTAYNSDCTACRNDVGRCGTYQKLKTERKRITAMRDNVALEDHYLYGQSFQVVNYAR